MPSVNISYYSKLEAVTVVVDGQKFTEREILLRYGTPADMQKRGGLAMVVIFVTGSFHTFP
ncbi:MAG TPA: hypothetical protein VFP47_12180 [Pyrinomonadaceae bacterium]|nr:hypothetical protein [Pyrinomonadaceae bacterium]